jgi:signal transduction histidine kinase
VRAGVARRWWDSIPAELIDNLSRELMANRNLLAALAGPSIAVTVDAEEGLKPVSLTGEDLTRVLVNLAKNSAEAMPAGGWIHLRLRECAASSEASPLASSDAQPSLLLTVEDNGPGIPGEVLDKIFNSGYTTRARQVSRAGSWPGTHRGLGLSISRSIIEGAGGRIHAANRSPSGACFEIELPIRNR